MTYVIGISQIIPVGWHLRLCEVLQEDKSHDIKNIWPYKKILVDNLDVLELQSGIKEFEQ